jgi:hypothetical protein
MTRAAAALACVLAIAVVTGTLPAGAALAAGVADERGLLAVMRRDGLLVPFAAFKGSRWTTPWPATIRNSAVPVNLDAIPEDWWGGDRPESWRLYQPGKPPRPFSTKAPLVYRAFCDIRVGLTTDYRSTEPIPMPPSDPYPKDGLAASSDLEVLTIESVDPSTAEATRLTETLTAEFDKAEERTLDTIRGRGGWTHPVRQPMRHQRPVTIEAWYRAPMDEPGWIASYVEAVRSYPPGPDDDGCGLETVFAGWFHQNVEDPRKSRPRLTAHVTYCDRLGVRYMLPLGRTHIDRQQYWIYQMSGFENEWYEVARVQPVKVSFAVEAYGGSTAMCPPRPRPGARDAAVISPSLLPSPILRAPSR